MRTSRINLLFLCLSATALAQRPAALPKLKVSENQRFLVQADGKPFFYLADTAWELFHRLDRKDAAEYLKTRAAQGYTVVQAVALAELDGLTTIPREGLRAIASTFLSRLGRHLDLVELRVAKEV